MKLLPCPFCATPQEWPKKEPEVGNGGIYRQHIRFACIRCRMNGPAANTLEEAARLWNERGFDHLVRPIVSQTLQTDARRQLVQGLLKWMAQFREGEQVPYDALVMVLGQYTTAPETVFMEE